LRKARRPRPRQRRDILVSETEILRPRELALRHWDTAGELREILAVGDLKDQPLDFAKHAACIESLGPVA
jgi:hypothetical protein